MFRCNPKLIFSALGRGCNLGQTSPRFRHGMAAGYDCKRQNKRYYVPRLFQTFILSSISPPSELAVAACFLRYFVILPEPDDSIR